MMASVSKQAIEAILFDLDGTLLDTITDMAQAANEMLLQLDAPTLPLETVTDLVGKGIGKTVERCLEKVGFVVDEALLQHAKNIYYQKYALENGKTAKFYPEALETLQKLKQEGRYPLACVTNKAEIFTRDLLRQKGLDAFFSVLVCGDTLPTNKPDPAMLLHACKLLDVAPQNTLMIGDSANDSISARAAGCRVLLLRYGYSEGIAIEHLDSDGVINSCAELWAYL